MVAGDSPTVRATMLNCGKLEGLKLIASGKVRDIYDIDEKTLLFVTTDRLSAFDVVMKTGVPQKAIKGRAMLVRKLKMLPIEAIVRGYITGSGWKDYKKTGKVCGISLPEGMQHCQKIEPPIFTPSTKAEQGLHDENISEARAREILKTQVSFISDGDKVMDEVVKTSIEIYTRAAEFAKTKGIILADTKMEWGIDREGNLVLG